MSDVYNQNCRQKGSSHYFDKTGQTHLVGEGPDQLYIEEEEYITQIVIHNLPMEYTVRI
ncbi:hypothetical protein ALC57_00800 [Trachymyrmex cornetzi]|uniref:Uncharacterized protein n=1 Tax=Trachymyrmex cornetzi TaxID=471704 RepID=A0A151JQT0_9HYME|nr:hypothetical protein ALC57_00800 [Trachymyrmex cornetzi]